MTSQSSSDTSMTVGEASAKPVGISSSRNLRPAAPGAGEAILWEGRPDSGIWRLLEFLGFAFALGMLSWLALLLIRPHLSGSLMAGQPDASSVPLILGMTIGVIAIIGLPVWLRSSARGRARYMLTNRRALIWLGDRIVGEAILFGADMRTLPVESPANVEFAARGVWLDWRLRDQGPDRVRFERIADAPTVAALAEKHGARWIDRPDTEQPPAES